MAMTEEDYNLAVIRLRHVPKEDRWKIAMQSLTPGGSEFMDPALCLAHLSAQRRELHELRCERARNRLQQNQK